MSVPTTSGYLQPKPVPPLFKSISEAREPIGSGGFIYSFGQIHEMLLRDFTFFAAREAWCPGEYIGVYSVRLDACKPGIPMMSPFLMKTENNFINGRVYIPDSYEQFSRDFQCFSRVLR